MFIQSHTTKSVERVEGKTNDANIALLFICRCVLRIRSRTGISTALESWLRQLNSVMSESFLDCIRCTGRVPLSIISRMNGVSRRTYAIHLKVGKKPVRDVMGMFDCRNPWTNCRHTNRPLPATSCIAKFHLFLNTLYWSAHLWLWPFKGENATPRITLTALVKTHFECVSRDKPLCHSMLIRF